MVCSDTNCWISYLAGEQGRDIELFHGSLGNGNMAMAPVVLAEMLSNPDLVPSDEQGLLVIPLLEITPGYWHRAGKLRAELFGLGYRPKLADTLIAQSCIDHQAGLITRDRDFRPFVRHGGLRLLA